MTTTIHIEGRCSQGQGSQAQNRIADCADHPEVQSSTGNLPEDQRIIIADVAGVTRSAVMTSSGTSSGNNRAIVPTTTEYFTASVKEALTLLQSVSSVIPVPFLSESFKVTLKIIELCEGASAVGEGVKELKARVRNLMTIIANHVKAQNYVERNKMIIANAMKGMEGDIGELLSTLKTIYEDLEKIGGQNKLKVMFTDVNTKKLEGCVDRLSTAMEELRFTNDLGNTFRLQNIESCQEETHNLMQGVATKLDKVAWRRDQLDIVVQQQMPLKPEIFHGREILVQDIARLLIKEESSRVCILGAGGMGKTSVSLAVVESALIKTHFSPEHLFWVPCNEAASATLLLELLYTQLQIPRNKHITLSEIISQLDAITQPLLILLDNFETPWNTPDGRQKVGDILRNLAMLKHVSILVTMRGSQAPCDKAITWQSRFIQPTDEEASLRIFRDINPDSENDPDVKALLARLGNMPFAVTLIANLGKQGQSTARELLNAWLKFGPDILPGQNEQSMNRSISLSVDGSLVKQNSNANLLLKVLSLLPAGTTRENLSWWAPILEKSMIPSAIAGLSAAAILAQQSTTSPVLSLPPVVQSFMQQQNRIEEDVRAQTFSSCCQYIIDNACRYDDPRFRVNAKDLAAEDTNIRSVLCSHSSSSDLSEKTIKALIALSWHYCDRGRGPEIACLTVEAAKAFGVTKYIASALWCLGRTSYDVSDHPAYANLQQAYQLFNTLPPDNLTQRFGGQCGIDFVYCARHVDEETKIVSLARDVEARCATLSDNLVHARSLMSLGVVLDTAKQRSDALHSLRQAIALLKVLKNNANLAYAYQITARVHCHQHQLQDALAAVETAWKYAELSDSPYLQAFISQEHAGILLSADRVQEAWGCFETSLVMLNEAIGFSDSESFWYGHPHEWKAFSLMVKELLETRVRCDTGSESARSSALIQYDRLTAMALASIGIGQAG
ncbi:uncharacterized protein LACBIDRAFT_325656 [Laccaria bicolor S238N-H82]|uniref:Predicted protein n=1 Tax=Laccaria bicolor (strain S238N-H82 / ATCC MYA-4686) TaxID=486041 RepID=B0D5S5_LACBS|nr:uncharacterized protein LACBIDRAFT_325656 [Laccaria bicolor S238N-H82]EDR10070.1 predicted protein [Laccaria bicolor S238N-H82]|eukprot:XP_001879455.1 predicted protein [Laccaria bicolor S238N-H82]